MDSAVHPPGPFALPLVGHNLAFVTQGSSFIARQAAKHGKVFRLSLYGQDVVVLGSPETVGWAMQQEGADVENKWMGNIPTLFAGSVGMIYGADHRARRKTLAPHFTPRGLDAQVSTLLALVERHVDSWIGQQMRLADGLQALAFEFICAYALGDISLLPCSLEAFAHDNTLLGDALFSLPFNLPGTALSKAVGARERVLASIEHVVAIRRAQGAAESDAHDACASLLRARDEHGQGLSDAKISQELLGLLFAGHETTVVTMCNWALFMVQHPHDLERVRAEHGELPSIESIRKRVFTRASVDETMRIRPTANFVFRQTQRPCTVQGMEIPAGWYVMLGIYLLHHDPELYSNPDRYEPERFLPPRQEHKAHRYAYLPFGGGPRVCLGMHLAYLEMHLIAQVMCERVDWALVPGQDLSARVHPTPLPKDGLRVRITPR